MEPTIVQNSYEGIHLELLKNVVKEYYISQQVKDHRLMERTLNNGLIEISGKGVYFTLSKSFYDAEMKKNEHLNQK